MCAEPHGTLRERQLLYGVNAKEANFQLDFKERFRNPVLLWIMHYIRRALEGFPGGSLVKNPPANAGEVGSIQLWEDPTCCGARKPVRRNC